MKELVSINGKVSAPEDARVSVFDRGFLYGDSVYEVVRSYNRVLFAIEPHVERLFKSAQRIYLDLGRSQAEVIEMIREAYRQSELNDAYVRVIVSRGEGPITLDPAASPGPTFVIMVKTIPKLDPKWYSDGIDLAVPEVIRNSRNAMDPNIKSGNYLNNVMAFAEAKKKHAHDAVILNRDGFVMECTTSNIFMIENDTLITPPDEADILHGITRSILKKLCKDHQIKWKEEYFNLARLTAASEVFTTGSVKEIVPVRTVGGQKIGSSIPGILTQKLMGLYRQYVQGYCEKARPS